MPTLVGRAEIYYSDSADMLLLRELLQVGKQYFEETHCQLHIHCITRWDQSQAVFFLIETLLLALSFDRRFDIHVAVLLKPYVTVSWPKKSNHSCKYSPQTTLERVPMTIDADIRRAAVETGSSLAVIIRQAVREWLDRRTENPPKPVQ